MIADLKPYPTMTDSRVEWLSQVPAHWKVSRLRNVADVRISNVDKHTREGEVRVRLCNYVDVYKNDHINATMDFMQATAAPDDIERYRLESGDVLVTKDSEAWDDIGVPALVTVPAPDLVSGYHLALLRSRSDQVVGGYLFRAIESNGIAHQFHVLAKGVTRYGLTHAGIKSVWLPVPSRVEQTAIVHFLDHADQRIRRYIRAKQKLITLLEEQKQAVIHEAVTGQIDVRTGRPYSTYKSSDVEWPGQVPEHWEVLPLKRAFASMDYGISDTGTDDGIIAVVTMGDIGRDGAVNVPERGGVTSVSPHLLLRDKDLLFNRTNSAELVAKVGMFRSEERPVTFASYLVRMRARRKNDPEFLNLLLNDVGFTSIARRAAIPSLHQSNLNPSRYGRLPIVLPPASEQEAVAELAKEAIAGVNRAVGAASHEIELLREYRTRLIADVVTGKLDVREAAAGLPEVDPLAAEGDSVDGVDHKAGSERTGWRHAVEEGGPLADVADA